MPDVPVVQVPDGGYPDIPGRGKISNIVSNDYYWYEEHASTPFVLGKFLAY